MKRSIYLQSFSYLLIVGLSVIVVLNSCLSRVDKNLNLINVESANDVYEFFSWSADRIPMVSAHRGGVYYEGFAENTIEMFEHVISQIPSIIEFDVRRSKDGALVLMHDRTTGRTTNIDKPIEDLTLEEIRALQLVDYKGDVAVGVIPTLEEVLDWGRGKVVFTVDVKAESDLDEVVENIIDKNAESYAVLITYSLDVAERLHQNYPNILLSVTVRNEDELQRLMNTNIDLSKIIAFTGTSARDKSFNDTLHKLEIFTILGTMGNIDNSAKARGEHIYRDLINSGSDILSTDYPVEAYKAFRELIPIESTKRKFFKNIIFSDSGL